MKTCKNCGDEFPNYIKINKKTKNISKRKYCLKCSPYGLHNTQTIPLGYIIKLGYKFCPKCKKQKKRQDEFYKKNKKGNANSSWCRKCFNDRMMNFWIERKLEVIKYKGGKCCKCGYNKNSAVLELHHKNPKEKEADWNKIKVMGKEKFKKEINKCILMCANCHRELHNPNNFKK